MKRALLVCLIILACSAATAKPMSMDISLSYGFIHMYTNNDFF